MVLFTSSKYHLGQWAQLSNFWTTLVKKSLILKKSSLTKKNTKSLRKSHRQFLQMSFLAYSKALNNLSKGLAQALLVSLLNLTKELKKMALKVESKAQAKALLACSLNQLVERLCSLRRLQEVSIIRQVLCIKG